MRGRNKGLGGEEPRNPFTCRKPTNPAGRGHGISLPGTNLGRMYGAGYAPSRTSISRQHTGPGAWVPFDLPRPHPVARVGSGPGGGRGLHAPSISSGPLALCGVRTGQTRDSAGFRPQDWRPWSRGPAHLTLPRRATPRRASDSRAGAATLRGGEGAHAHRGPARRPPPGADVVGASQWLQRGEAGAVCVSVGTPSQNCWAEVNSGAKSKVRARRRPRQRTCEGSAGSPGGYSKWALSSKARAERTRPTPPARSGAGW